MYRYSINDLTGAADSIDAVLADLYAELRRAAALLGRCRWAITSPADRLHTGASTFGQPDHDEYHINTAITTVRDNLEYDATQPPLN